MSQQSHLANPTTTLTVGDIEAIAEATALRLSEIVGSGATTFGLVDARQLALELGGVCVDIVERHPQAVRR